MLAQEDSSFGLSSKSAKNRNSKQKHCKQTLETKEGYSHMTTLNNCIYGEYIKAKTRKLKKSVSLLFQLELQQQPKCVRLFVTRFLFFYLFHNFAPTIFPLPFISNSSFQFNCHPPAPLSISNLIMELSFNLV